MSPEDKIKDYFKKEGSEMNEMTDKEMVDSLLRTLNVVKNELSVIKAECSKMNDINKLAMEGLVAIAKFGDSQEIAIKTISQIDNLQNN
tara:strand:- start:374 stop:640 length:267 start_codon:yes stop_codon:yes gene_type:complete